MRVPALRTTGSLGINLTPMIDVVFLLIIFFLMSSHLAQQETNVELELPAADSGDDRPATAPHRVLLNVPADGRLLLGGEAIEPGELARRLAREREHHPDDLEVRIRADRRAPYRVVEPALSACAEAGVWRVQFAVVAGEGD